jgi:hypothetical protein
MATAREMIVQTEYGFTHRAIPLSLDLGMTETDDGQRYLFDTHTPATDETHFELCASLDGSDNGATP